MVAKSESPPPPSALVRDVPSAVATVKDVKVAAETVEEWAKRKRVDPFFVASAKVLSDWATGGGTIVTEAEFDAAIEQAKGLPIGGGEEPAK